MDGIARHATARTRIKNLVIEENIMGGRLGNDYARSKIKQNEIIKKRTKEEGESGGRLKVKLGARNVEW
jgi:hypothetical protein